MMTTVLYQAMRRRAVQSFFLILLLTFSSYALASNSSISGNVKSGRCSPDVKVHDHTERKLAAVPTPEPAVSGNASAPGPSNLRPPTPPPNSRPALISPSDDTPGTDLPPRILSPPPASEPPRTSPILSSKELTAAWILGFAIVVLVVLIVFFSALKLCWQPRSSQLMRYERHMPT